MKKNYLSLFSLLLAIVMLVSALAACSDIEEDSTEGSTVAPAEETVSSEQTTTKETEPHSETGSENETTSETATRTERETASETEKPIDPSLEENVALIVKNADELKNGVTGYYKEGTRQSFIFENQQMLLEYALSAKSAQQVTVLQNKDGKAFIDNTMDVFVTLKNGKRYFASASTVDTYANIHRLGYYFYEMRMEKQAFEDPDITLDNTRVDHLTTHHINQGKRINGDDGTLTIKNAGGATDPFVILSQSLSYPADEYAYLEFSMKADSKAEPSSQVFIMAGDATYFSYDQCVNFSVNNDNEYHTYRIGLNGIKNMKDLITGIRFDINGSGATYAIQEVKLVKKSESGAPDALSVNRSFMVYSDKMHQVIQVAATESVSDIAEVGMLTEIDADTVAKLIVKDKNGTHETLDGVDWASAEYVGFDIKAAGIFGYILPFDGKGGSFTVTLNDGVYAIIQTMAPKDNKIIPSEKGTGNANDFYMGQRIYTDDSHSFEAFLKEAYCERNPLSKNSFTVHEDYSTSGTYSGYDSLRGIYKFTLAGPSGGFGTPYYYEPNRHYRVSFDIKGDGYDRDIYVMTYTRVGVLECAVLLDKDDVLLPVPLEVGKNFSEPNGERNIFNLDDSTYGEVIFPMVVKANSSDNSYSVLNLHHLWGQYPLKQIGWIQYTAPYYHLSTGVTETNCIVPMYSRGSAKSLNTLPDFRTMSAPFLEGDPQHVSSGVHRWLKYTDADGNYAASENTWNSIDSYGPIYADIKMDFISDDGRIKVSYTHMEMPQTDENRSYYEMRYEILEDISFNDFSRDFQFYSVQPNESGRYQKLGFWNKTEVSAVVNASTGSSPREYMLGKNCPYFTLFDMKDSSNASGYGNVAFLIYNSEFVIGGEKADPNFAIVDHGSENLVALTLALDEVTLKAGDSFVINAILMPWGSQESDYSGSAPDKNVRDVRENTILNPLKVNADADCKVLESTYLPKVSSTNGVSAEFTLSGGENNVAVRVYGLEKMTVPTIYEKIDGKWVEYVVNSAATPDLNGDAHHYDGYSIHYDGNGLYSYSFIVTMKDGAPRSFKLVADGNYKKWEKEPVPEVASPDLLNVYIDHKEFSTDAVYAMLANSYISSFEVNDEEGFIRLFGAGAAGAPEAYAKVFEATSEQVTGQYVVLKYRFPEENAETIDCFEFYTSTTVRSAKADNGFQCKLVEADGKWHILVVDLTQVKNSTFRNQFTAAGDGSYKAQFLRVDFFDRHMSESSYIDVAFIGMHHDLKEICTIASGVDYITVVEGDAKYMMDPATGEKETYMNSGSTVSYIDPASGYTASTLPYASNLDMLNGRGSGGARLFSGRGGTSVNGVDTFKHNGTTIDGCHLVFSGWSMVEGGVHKYVWSADGGKTWQDAVLHNDNKIRSAGDAYFKQANKKAGVEFSPESAANVQYQGTPDLEDVSAVEGLSAELSAYAGKTVNVIFAAVPETAQDTLCLLYYVIGVTVSAE